MSYDVHVTYTAPQTECFNVTFNLRPMFVLALGEGGINQFHGEKAGDCISLLQSALTDMEAEPDKYRHLNPANGYGNYEGAFSFLRDLLQVCRERPHGDVEIFR